MRQPWEPAPLAAIATCDQIADHVIGFHRVAPTFYVAETSMRSMGGAFRRSACRAVRSRNGRTGGA